MAERPIIFSAPMVRALLREIETPGAGKTQTRRLAWRTRWSDGGCIPDGGGGTMDYVEPHEESIGPTHWQKVQPGDVLWVREKCVPVDRDGRVSVYAADYEDGRKSFAACDWIEATGGGGYPEACRDYSAAGENCCWATSSPVRWTPSIHMPRWACRILLDVTAVRVERLQAISEGDARAEGLTWVAPTFGVEGLASSWHNDPRDAFRALWTELHGPDAWDANPEVVVITFKPKFANKEPTP